MKTILYTPDEAAERLHTKPRNLERWRSTGYGPRYVRIGRRVCYRAEDLDAWLETQIHSHTAEERFGVTALAIETLSEQAEAER